MRGNEPPLLPMTIRKDSSGGQMNDRSGSGKMGCYREQLYLRTFFSARACLNGHTAEMELIAKETRVQ